MINIKTRGQNQVVERKTKRSPQMGAVLVKQKKKQKQTLKWGQCSSSKIKGRKEKTDNWPLFWGPALVKEMKNELAPKWGPALIERKKKEKKNKPPNGGSAHQAKEKKETPKWGSAC